MSQPYSIYQHPCFFLLSLTDPELWIPVVRRNRRLTGKSKLKCVLTRTAERFFFPSYIFQKARRVVTECWSGESPAVLFGRQCALTPIKPPPVLHELQKTPRENMWTFGSRVKVSFGLSCFSPLWYPAIEFPRLTCINQLNRISLSTFVAGKVLQWKHPPLSSRCDCDVLPLLYCFCLSRSFHIERCTVLFIWYLESENAR